MAIDKSAVEQMFADIRAETDWDIDGPMLWGYFFTDPDPTRLKRLGEQLSQDGYRFVDIFSIESDQDGGPGPGEQDGDVYFLHVERVETHTPWSLELRNRGFEALAGRFEVASYDGMDVGPPPLDSTSP
ncbi:MAG TPA: hypothetical protein DDZ67_08595 [Xanthomonadaceae bacterium]|nr:hypothetical protein [Xanthomonadaceae bacterium]